MSSEIKVDTISENTSGNGVAIDGLTIKDGGITATTGATVFNEGSADIDFRIESNDKTNMFFVDAGNNKIGINITGFTASITPSSTSSKILVISNWMWGSSASPYPKFILLRGSTSINIGDTDTGATRVSVGNNTDPAGDEGNIQQEQLAHHFLDSPSSASSVTYKWQTKSFNSGRTIYVGRTADVSDGNRATAPSNITLVEILQ